ncbi:hypothetical protein TELCIR_01301 [Teladorsagia circumcincta]|uniref:FZ domain-containing protein n=1 Tax=Teladorsagia circumcincta TaxID=45464 RepID=A0A2G9V2A6_TELCI|nr:hypothetical protein TELCIR_01301 [Teladorsagia circumcincta]
MWWGHTVQIGLLAIVFTQLQAASIFDQIFMPSCYIRYDFRLRKENVSQSKFHSAKKSPIIIRIFQIPIYNRINKAGDTQPLLGLMLQTNTEHFKPLIKTKCNRNIQFFVCSVFAPMCPEGMPQAVTSCRSVCEQTRMSSAGPKESFTFRGNFLSSVKLHIYGQLLELANEPDDSRGNIRVKVTKDEVCEGTRQKALNRTIGKNKPHHAHESFGFRKQDKSKS